MAVKLPVVSGSSGRLVVERAQDEAAAQYPERVFEDPALDYVGLCRSDVGLRHRFGPTPAI